MKSEQIMLHQKLMSYITSRWISKLIYIAAKLDIADILEEKSRPVEELAELTGTYPPFLYRVLRALSSVGIFTESSYRIFSNNAMGELLKTGYLKSAALLFNSEWSDQSWQKLLTSMQTGITSFELAHHQNLNNWLKEHPRPAEIFNDANAYKIKTSFYPALSGYDFSSFKKITDIGGGTGTLMFEILYSNPHLQGTIADQPEVIKITNQKIKQLNLENRCQAVQCDFFQEIPGGSDIYIMANVLHDWPDRECLKILKTGHKNIDSTAKLIVLEYVIPPGNKPSVSKLLDMEMLVITGGRERTEQEYQQLFSQVGFKVSSITYTPYEVGVLELIKQ